MKVAEGNGGTGSARLAGGWAAVARVLIQAHRRAWHITIVEIVRARTRRPSVVGAAARGCGKVGGSFCGSRVAGWLPVAGVLANPPPNKALQQTAFRRANARNFTASSPRRAAAERQAVGCFYR